MFSVVDVTWKYVLSMSILAINHGRPNEKNYSLWSSSPYCLCVSLHIVDLCVSSSAGLRVIRNFDVIYVRPN